MTTIMPRNIAKEKNNPLHNIQFTLRKVNQFLPSEQIYVHGSESFTFWGVNVFANAV